MKYSRSCLVQWHDKNGKWLERVLEIDPATGELACIKIGGDPKQEESEARPFWRTKESLEQALDEDRARVIANEKDPYLKPPIDPKRLPDSRRVQWEKISEASRELLHWETQGQTSQASSVGQNLIHHQERGYTMLFFVRSRKKVDNVTSPFTYLGSATLVSHQSERPIQMIWRLTHPMPAEIFEENRRGG